jgi:putative transcriptional regulator
VEEFDKSVFIDLGKRISRLRKEKSLTQAQLSDFCEMEESAIRRVELGGTNPTLKTLLRISRGLQIPLKELLDFPMH